MLISPRVPALRLLLPLLLLACAPEAPPASPVAPPAPAPPPPAPVPPPPPPTPSAAPEPAAPEPTATDAPGTLKATRKGAVAFYMTWGSLLPLCAYDKTARDWVPAAEGIDMIGPGASIQFESGDTATAKGLLGQAGDGCYFSAPRIDFTMTKGQSGTGFAVSPAEAGKIRLMRDAMKEVGATERALLLKAIKAEVAGIQGPLKVLQAASSDLDGDGKEERFFSVIVAREKKKKGAEGEGSSDKPFAFSGLFVAPGGNTGALALIFSEAADEIYVEGSFDLDGDGKREIWSRVTNHFGPDTAQSVTVHRGGDGQWKQLVTTGICQ